MTASTFVLDGSLARIAGCIRLTICASEPADFAAIAGVSLGSVVTTTGDFPITSAGQNRAISQAQKAVTPTASGTVTYWSYDDGSQLLYTNPTSAKAVTLGINETLGNITITNEQFVVV
jgi:hypothetical protein